MCGSSRSPWGRYRNARRSDLYSPAVIQARIERFESKHAFRLTRHSIAGSIERSEAIVSLRKEDGSFKRPLKKEEISFIRNDRIVSMLDFLYWFERYYKQIKDGAEGGGLGNFRLWESQRLILELMAGIEREQFEASERGQPVDGILIVDHKARQVGHTGLFRAITMHRATCWTHQRCCAISVDEKKLDTEIYGRDLLAFDNLPWFMKPGIEFNEKDDHIQFDTHSRVTYMQATQKSSLGQSSQFDCAHLTEVSEYAYPDMIEVDFVPTLPQNVMTFCALESRANGRGNWWHEFTEAVRHGRKQRWRYSFIPWYAEPIKYRRVPPANWVPSEESVRYAQMVHETSPEWVGKNLYLTKEQLYWWESTRDEHYQTGKLHLFLTNYPATPEESFQHTGGSVFAAELLDGLRRTVGSTDPRHASAQPYELRRTGEDFAPPEGSRHPVYRIPHCGALVPMDRRLLDADPRGIVWIYEEPVPGATYFLGVDPTKGIVGWNRQMRSENDFRVDNGAVGVIRVGTKGRPDAQAAEFAAPIDAEDLADWVNALGRVYAGANEDGQAMAIIEVWPGPGEPTQRRLITHYGYTNLYVPIRYANTLVPERGRNVVGWVSNQRSRRDLWTRGSKHIILGRITLRSPWLVEEMADCQPDDWMLTETARARHGRHDDRVVQVLLSIYAAHDWGAEVETDTTRAETGEKVADWQATDVSASDMMDAWEDTFSQISDG